jgi:hypothetical protein
VYSEKVKTQIAISSNATRKAQSQLSGLEPFFDLFANLDEAKVVSLAGSANLTYKLMKVSHRLSVYIRSYLPW